MKIVQVSNTLRIKNSDRMNWNVEELRVAPETLKSGKPNPKAGEERWKALHYYPKLEYACAKCIDMQVTQHADDAVTLKGVVIEINNARKAVIEAIGKMQVETE